jgi:protein-disulfide isomerase
MAFVRSTAVVLLALALGCGQQQGGSGGPSASDATIQDRVVDYFQKTVNTPGLSFKVEKLEPSEVAGWRKGVLKVSLGDQSQDVAFYVSPDGRYLFRGDAVDLTVDPLDLVMQKIALTNQPTRGAPDAKVTIVEYSDFQCPFCARVYSTLEDDVLKNYGDKVRFVFKNFPLPMHPWAEDAALASECAFQQSNDGFWALYNGFFKQQGQITKENVKAKAGEIAQGAGLDGAKLSECIDNKGAMDAVKADESEASALGVNSTPTFFVNGRRLAGAQTPESFKQLIDQALAKG